jgi:glutamate synthase (NADPH) small chain
MGKITGFLEYQRLEEAAIPPAERKRNYGEFVLHLTDQQAQQQGARCMDCGIPFCQTGCPIHNIIPDWNDLVYHQRWQEALETLHSTNNFPEFTGRVCPAPCEAACTLNLDNSPVGIKSIEHAIIDKGWDNGWVVPQPPKAKTGRRVAVVGSGPAGLAAAQQLARAGHDVIVYEKNDRIGGLLRYGIPDFKMEKHHIDRRVAQMQAEGVQFRLGVTVGGKAGDPAIADWSADEVSTAALLADFDAVVVAVGAEQPRDLPIPGRELAGVHYAMQFLPWQNKVVAGDTVQNQLLATDKHVVVIGGGDTGSDCVGTSNRHGARSVSQFEIMPKPPVTENKAVTWPYWPTKLRTSSSHEEGCERDWSIVTKRFEGENGHVKRLIACRVEWRDGKMQEIAGSEFAMPADLVLLAMGFVSPNRTILEAFGVDRDNRGNASATTEGAHAYATNIAKVFAAGDARRGQSLVVWAIREGRQCARAVDAFLMGKSELAG